MELEVSDPQEHIKIRQFLSLFLALLLGVRPTIRSTSKEACPDCTIESLAAALSTDCEAKGWELFEKSGPYRKRTTRSGFSP